MAQSFYPAKSEKVRWIQRSSLGVLLDPDTRRYYTLNGVAMCIWNMCDGVRDIRQLAQELQRTYRVTMPRALKDITMLVAYWSKRGLVVPHKSNRGFYPREKA